MLNIPFYAQDKHSGIDNIDLKLYHGSGNDLGQFVMDLANNITDEKTVTLDASTLQNGPYTLKLTATDNAGNTAELYRDFDVYNRVGKPGITVMTQNNGAELRVDWSYSSTPSGLDHLEYSLNDGDWVSVSDSNTAQGYFTVSVTGLTGTNHIRVRGVDSNDVEGDAARREFTIDPVPPAVDLTAVTRGILSGSVTDTNLRKWELFIKETNANDSTYAKIGEGKNTAVNGRICFVDLSGGTYTNNTSYTLKLKATDKAGNVTDDTISFTYRSSWSAASFLGTADRVKRNLGQSYSADTFLMTVNDDNEVTLDISGDTELSNISWYLNNSYIGTGRTLTYELTGTELTGSNDIFFTAEDSLGNIVLSRDLYVDSNEEIIPFDTPASGQIVQEEVLSEEAAALRFDLPEDSAVTYSVKVGSGSYHQISSGELVYISDLDSDIVKTDTFTIKAEGAQRTLQSLEDFAVYITTYSEESFAVTTAPMEAYWPEGFRAVDKINYKTYLYWDVPEGLPNDISYEVHRSTEEDFDPSDSTLVAEDIREGYWCDINLNYEVDLYYKVRGVQKENDIVVGASSFTDCRTASAISRNEYLKHLGHKEYWGYAEVKTPNGTGYIEKFDGNFFYSASDATVPNESLPISFTRSYNSGSTSRSSLGYGWTHNYDIALIKVGSDEDLENSTLALRDGQGTIYTFSRVNGTYVSSMGKYLTLKEESTSHNYTVTSGNSTEQFSFASNYTMFSRDGMKFYFDEYGKLLLIEEANGNILIFSYDPERGLLEKITTGRGINIDFIYYDGDNGTDPLTIKEMRLPDGSKTVYGYTSGSRLNSVKNYPVNPANQNDCITYNYTYSNKKMVGLTDGSGNAYSITYGSDPRTVTFAYPSIQNQAAEGTRVTVGNTTVTERLIGGSAVTREEDTFDSFGQVIEHRIYTGNEYVSETYYYVNNLVATETTKQVYDILELSDDGMSGTITKAEKEVAVEHLYDGNDNSISDSYDTINDKVSEVDYSYDSNGTTEWNEYLPVETTETIDGVVVSHEESEYDAAGNLTESKDYTNHELIEYMYADGTGSEPKGTLVSEENWLMNSNGQKAGLISSMETTVSYSGTNKIETVTNDAGDDRIVEETTYDQMGRVTERIVYTYTDYGQTSQKISKERHQYTFDGYGRVAAETTTTSNVNANLVNISGTVVTKSSTKSYYPNGALASETDERGVTSSYTYDALNRLVSTTVSKGNQTQTTTTSYSYGPVTIHDGKGGTLSYSNCLITTESDGNLEIHKTYQDGQGRVVREIDDGVITDYSYDLNGNRVIDFLVTEKAQDIQDEEGITTYTLYNEEGTAYGSVIEPAWENDRFIITEDSIVEVNYFDDRGNISGSRDPLGNITEFGYDQENRLTSVTLPDTGTNITTFNYSESSNNSGDYTSTVTMTDALGARSVEVSDASGNTVSISDNGKQNENITAIATQFEHDGAGRVTKEIKMSGEYITYSYDSSGRLTQRSEFTSTNTELTRTVYTYVGTTENILSMSDYRIENGSPVLYHYEEFGYDNLGRMISKAEINGASFPSDLTPYTISYSYDIHDNITGIVYGSAIPTEISSINYTYSGERLTSVSAVINNVEYLLKEYTYTDWGAVETVKDYYDFKTSGTSKYILLTYGYDRLTNLFEMVYTKEDDTVIESHYYSYDKAGKIITEENYSSLSDFNEIRRFEYDSLGRLVLSDIKDIVEESGNTSEENKLITEYTYDKVGNRLTKTENGEETAYVYNGLDQLLTETKGTDTLTYSYDSNGNQTGVTGTSDGETVSKTMTYTPGGMMETYSDGERVEQNTYIRGETRIKKAEGPSLQNLTDITNYFYQEGSVLYTTDNDNEAKSFNLLNISDIFATEREGENTEEHYFYLDDIRGSKTELIDNSAGNIVSYWYNDFGEVSEERNEDYEDFINEVQYTGAIYDGSTGLLYLNARFYDPATGSFTSQDSYRGERGEPDSWHLYAYCADDPVNCVDPNGHKWVLVGTGLQIGLSLGCLWKTFCCGIDIIWFNSYLKRYNNRSMHIYAVYGANYSCATFNKLLGTTKLKPFNLFSNRGVKGIAKSLLKGANIAVHASLIQADTKMYKSYLNYEKGGLYFSVGAGAVATVSTGGSNMTIGLGVSSSKVFSMSLGWTYTKFLSNVTASTRSFFDKIESTARNRANTLKSNPSGHCGIAK